MLSDQVLLYKKDPKDFKKKKSEITKKLVNPGSRANLVLTVCLR